MLRMISRHTTGRILASNTRFPLSAKHISVPPSEIRIDEASDDAPVEMNNPFQKEKQQCILCKMQITPDFKNVKLLSQFVSPYTGQIYGRHITGLCRHKQTQIEKEIRKAQSAGFMAIALKDLVFMRDPKLFDPDRPFRPHKY